ncbi:MAG TPA: hypothetical protein VFS21_40295 [Roseiflexaceae bacterium]|nr:hypothetical protein [Roseiflexaceae bacterium]
MSELLPLVVTGLLGAALAWIGLSRRGGRRYYVNLSDTVHAPRLQPCKPVDAGVQLGDRTIRAEALINRVVQSDDGTVIYISSIDRIDEADEVTMQKARKGVFLGALFAGGGDDMLHYLQIAACVVPLIACVLLWSSFQQVQTTLNAQSATLAAVNKRLETPLVAVPQQQPTAQPRGGQ